MWFTFALISAFLGAIDIILNKKCLEKVSPALLSLALYSLTLPILILLVLNSGLPTINQFFYYGVLGSAVTFTIAKIITYDSFKQNQLSKIFPLTAFSGIFTYIFGLLLLSETIRLIPIIGLFSVIIGSYLLNIDQAKEGLLKPFRLIFTNKLSILFLFAVLLASLTAVFDKIEVKNTDPYNPLFTIFIEQLIMSFILFFYLRKKENHTWYRQLKNNLFLLFINSALFLIVALLVFYAF